MDTCANCQAQLAPEWKYCIRCGSPVRSAPRIPGAIRPDPDMAQRRRDRGRPPAALGCRRRGRAARRDSRPGQHAGRPCRLGRAVADSEGVTLGGWGRQRVRFTLALGMLFAGGLIVQTTSVFALWLMLLGAVVHAAGWVIVPGKGWRRSVAVVPGVVTMVLILNGASAMAALAMPLAAWLLVRERAALAYLVLGIPILTAYCPRPIPRPVRSGSAGAAHRRHHAGRFGLARLTPLVLPAGFRQAPSHNPIGLAQDDTKVEDPMASSSSNPAFHELARLLDPAEHRPAAGAGLLDADRRTAQPDV